MSDTIPKELDEQDVTAQGGTLKKEITFYRDEATLTTDHTLKLPSNNGTFVFSKDPKDSIRVNMDEIESFLVGPIFHKPNDPPDGDPMGDLINEHGVVLLVTLIDEHGNNHYLHYLLDHIE